MAVDASRGADLPPYAPERDIQWLLGCNIRSLHGQIDVHERILKDLKSMLDQTTS